MNSLVRSLMALLLEEVSLEEFEQRTESVRDQADRGPCDAAEVGATVSEAKALRKLLDRYKRRSAELVALYDTAGDLSSLRDIELVLEAIVKRARQLLATDVAYLMLTDEVEGDTYMRATAGTVTPSFASLRLELGAGLGGVVAETGSPHWTENYLADKRYLHAVDAIVEEERLLAILGVPLKIGRRVIGVLFAADRRPRVFEQEETSLLLSLAAHAAIAIENASRFQDAKSSLTRLTQAMKTIELQNDALERAAGMHEQLMDLVASGGTELDIAATVADGLSGELLVLDGDSRIVAFAGPPVGSSWAALRREGADAAVVGPQGLTDAVRKAAETGRAIDGQVAGSNCHVVPVRAGDSTLGTLIFLGRSLDDADRRTLERAATVTALLSLNQRSRDEVENRLRGELLAEMLVASPSDIEGLVRRAALAGVDLTSAAAVVVCAPAAALDLNRLEAAAVALARSEGGLVTREQGCVVLFLPTGDAAVTSEQVAQFMKERRLEVTVGADGPVFGIVDMSLHEAQARRCAKMLAVLGRTGDAATAEQLGSYGLLMSEASQPQLRSFIEAALGPVERYDASRGTSLVTTMERFFDADGNVARAAEILFVHPNTLRQRLDRLEQILGPGWRAGERAMEIRLALRLHQLARTAAT